MQLLNHVECQAYLLAQSERASGLTVGNSPAKLEPALVLRRKLHAYTKKIYQKAFIGNILKVSDTFKLKLHCVISAYSSFQTVVGFTAL